MLLFHVNSDATVGSCALLYFSGKSNERITTCPRGEEFSWFYV